MISLTAAAMLAFPNTANAAPPPPIETAFLGPVLNVVAIEPELAFYQTIFGLKLAMTLDTAKGREYMLSFPHGTSQGSLILFHDTSPGAVRKVSHGQAFNRLVLRTGDMDALIERLKAAGMTYQPPTDPSHGYRVLTLKDPEGYALEIVQSTTTH